jgi:drug/metabolite transporter (DMT)-like permease
MDTPDIRLLPLIIISVLCWGFAFPFIFFALDQGITPANLTILRFIVVCFTFLGLYLAKRKVFTPLERKDVIPLFLLGFFGVIVYHLGLNYGQQFVTPGVASLIIATIPIYTVIMALVFLKERITPLIALGILISLVGVIIITLWGKPDTELEIDYLLGAVGVFIAAIVGAAYTIAGKKYLERYTPLSLTTYAMLLGSLGLIPFVTPSFMTQITSLTLPTIGAILFLGVCSTVVAYTVWYIVLAYTTASSLSAYVYAVPLVSTVASYLFFGHTVTVYFIVGGVLVIGGLMIVNRQRKKPRLRM